MGVPKYLRPQITIPKGTPIMVTIDPSFTVGNTDSSSVTGDKTLSLSDHSGAERVSHCSLVLMATAVLLFPRRR